MVAKYPRFVKYFMNISCIAKRTDCRVMLVKAADINAGVLVVATTDGSDRSLGSFLRWFGWIPPLGVSIPISVMTWRWSGVRFGRG